MMDDLRETAETVKAWPPHLRTQSSPARMERDIQRLGYDPRFGRPAVAEALSEQTIPAKPTTIETDYSTETFRRIISN